MPGREIEIGAMLNGFKTEFWALVNPDAFPSLQCIMRMPSNESAPPKCTFEISIVTLFSQETVKWITPIPSIQVTFKTDKERRGAVPFDLQTGSANNQYIFECGISELNWQEGFFVGLAIIPTDKYSLKYEDHGVQPPLMRSISTERKCSIKVFGPPQNTYGQKYRARG
jgi:hypothetical protein